MSISTSTGTPSRPTTAQLNTFANMFALPFRTISYTRTYYDRLFYRVRSVKVTLFVKRFERRSSAHVAYASLFTRYTKGHERIRPFRAPSCDFVDSLAMLYVASTGGLFCRRT